MEKDERIIGGKHCRIYSDEDPEYILVQPAGEEDIALLDSEVEKIKDLTKGKSRFTLAAFYVEDWQCELSPWEAPPVFGEEGFGSGGGETLLWLTQRLLPALGGAGERPVFLGGYSLAGLFALWAAYQTERLSGTAGVSPSVWFPGWDDFADNHSVNSHSVYLSLGVREPKTRNRTMAGVGDAIRRQYDRMKQESLVKAYTLDWNEGNHFTEPEIRMAKGFAWMINSWMEQT